MSLSPTFHFVPGAFQRDFSSIQHYSAEEQLNELTGAPKRQFERHCFIQLPKEKTQPMLVPRVEDYYTSKAVIDSYKGKEARRHHGLSAYDVDALIDAQETALLHEVSTGSPEPDEPEESTVGSPDASETPCR